MRTAESYRGVRIRSRSAQQVRSKLEDWRGLLTRNVEDGRELFRQVLVGPLRFTPEGRQYRFQGEVELGRLLSGVVGLPTFVASPPGFVTLWTAELVGRIAR